jgi:hypothetical protein
MCLENRWPKGLEKRGGERGLKCYDKDEGGNVTDAWIGNSFCSGIILMGNR